MDIKGSEEKLNQVDSFLTTLTKVLKKHWLILTLLLIGFFFYWALNSDVPVTEEEQVTPTQQYDQGMAVDTSTVYEEEYDSTLVEE